MFLIAQNLMLMRTSKNQDLIQPHYMGLCGALTGSSARHSREK